MVTTLLSNVLLGIALTAAGPSDGSSSAETAKRFDLLGLQMCIDDPGDAKPCHVRLFSATAPPRRADDSTTAPLLLQVTAFGKSLCVGPVPDHAACDVRVWSTEPSSTAA